MGASCCQGQRRVPTKDEETNTSADGVDESTQGTSSQQVASGDYRPLHTVNDVYPITHDPKGLVLILNNYFESKRCKNKHRVGSEVDVKNMERVWTDLGCKLHRGAAQWDKTAVEMEALIHEMTMIKKDEFDFVAIIIMSHGGLVGGGKVEAPGEGGKPMRMIEQSENVFYGSDGEPVKVQKIIEKFSNKNAKNLQNIPKLFFFQFCQGDKNDEGVVQTDTLPFEKNDDDVIIKSTEVRIPTVSDILIVYPTQQEHLTYKTRDGSWFINAVTEVFDQYATSEHVVDLLTRVNGIMAKKHGLLKEEEHGSKVVHVRCKAMSNFESSLTKKLYFYP